MTLRLKARQRVFVDEYLVDLNATQAAVRAGYSAKTARRTAQGLLVQARIKAALDDAMAERARRTAIAADRVLVELARIAFADAGKAMQWKPGAAGADPDTTAAVSGIWQTRHGLRVRMHDKVAALTLLGRHLGLFRNEAAAPGPPADERTVVILPDNGRD